MTTLPQSRHFDLQELAKGVFAAIHKPGGGAYSNAGIIDLGNRNLVFDAFDTTPAALDLRSAGETLISHRADWLIISHPHGDHWHGAQAFDLQTTMIASEATRRAMPGSAKNALALKDNPSELETYIGEMEEQLKTDDDPRVRAGLEKSILRLHHASTTLPNFEPRYTDQTFVGQITFDGSHRRAELISHGTVHSEGDVTLTLPEDGIAFIGDIGFFQMLPYMRGSDLGNWRSKLRELQDWPYEVFVPGHGPVGGKTDIALMLDYFDVFEKLMAEVVEGGGTLEEALGAALPAPFDEWLMGSMGRWEVNVKYVWGRMGGNEGD